MRLWKSLNPSKVVFKEPIVKATIDKVRFPQTCPICSKSATKASRVTTVPGKKQYLRPEWDPSFYPSVRRRAGIPAPRMKTFLVPVCDDHYRSDGGTTNIKTLCLIGDGLMMGALLFGLLAAGGDLWLRRSISPWIPPVFALAILSFLVTYLAFRPGPLESSVRVVGFDAGIQNVWLAFKNTEYREKFLKENPMYAEAINWIIKS